jgi:hypothetical protein
MDQSNSVPQPVPRRVSAPRGKLGPTFPWVFVLCLVGLDYFSTLSYLPTIAYRAAGIAAPLAILSVVFTTLFLALPIYLYVVGRSPHGSGAIALLDELVRGWFGKIVILVFLGFLATDFVITRSLSVADASIHIRMNPFWQEHVDWVRQNEMAIRNGLPEWIGNPLCDFVTEQMVLSVLLSILGFGFYFFVIGGFNRSFMRLATFVVIAYLLCTAILIVDGVVCLAQNPYLVDEWWRQVNDRAGLANGADHMGEVSVPLTPAFVGWVLLMGLVTFPQMALGLSGFELSLASAPLLRTENTDSPDNPRGRIRRARWLMAVAGAIMIVFTVSAVAVVTLLVPADNLSHDGLADHRALAYLAHGGILVTGQPAPLPAFFGRWFGTLYDLCSVTILCLAGASVTISLRDLVPSYLTKFGMQLEWARRVGVILHLFNLLILCTVVLFRADVDAQQWAYSTSVLILLAGASFAAWLHVWRRWENFVVRAIVQLPFFLVGVFFLGMSVYTITLNPTGLAIALGFVMTIMVTGFFSRYLRSTELRFEKFDFVDDFSKLRWEQIYRFDFQVLVPHRPGQHSLEEKNVEIRKRHRLHPDIPIIFIEVTLGDPSNFTQTPLMQVVSEGGLEVIRLTHVASVAHGIAAVALRFSEVGRPPELIFGWSNETPIAANLSFLLLGVGNVPWMVRELIRKAQPDIERQPRVVVG